MLLEQSARPLGGYESIFFLSVAFVCYRIWLRISYIRAKRASGCEDPPKYPHLDPILGYDYWKSRKRAAQQSTWLPSSKALFDKYGKTYEVNDLGRRTIHTMEIENIQHAWANDHKKWVLGTLRDGLTVPLFDKGINTTDGEFWHHSRTLIRPTFARTEISDLDFLSELTDRLIEQIPANGAEVDLQPLFQCLFLDMTTYFLFGESIDSLNPDQRQELGDFIKAFDYCLRGIGDRMRLGPLRFLHRDKKWHECIRFVHSHIDRWIDRAIERQQKTAEGQEEDQRRYILIDEMAKQTQDREDLRSQIIAVFVPARDATAQAMSNIFHVLSRRPDVYEKVRQEVLSFGDQELTFETLKSMKYMQWVLKEGYRTHPISTHSIRQAVEDTYLPVGGGPDGKSPILIKKGDVIQGSLWNVHQDKDVWGSDVAEFRPERWDDWKVTWTFLPFMGGPRICPAQQMVLTQESYILARFARKYAKIQNAEPQPWTEGFKIVYHSKYGVKVRLTEA